MHAPVGNFTSFLFTHSTSDATAVNCVMLLPHFLKMIQGKINFFLKSKPNICYIPLYLM